MKGGMERFFSLGVCVMSYLLHALDLNVLNSLTIAWKILYLSVHFMTYMMCSSCLFCILISQNLIRVNKRHSMSIANILDPTANGMSNNKACVLVR